MSLLPPTVAGVNSIRGSISVGEDGTITFDTYLSRDDVNVSLGTLNTLRETDITPTQHVLLVTDGAVATRIGDKWAFNLQLGGWLDEYDFTINFPANTEFKEISSNMQYTRDSNSLHFRGVLTENPKIDAIYSTKTKNNQPGFTYIHISAVFLVVVIVAIAIFLKIKNKKKLNQDILKTLNQKEREIITLLFENSGRLTQTRLRQKTGLPKSTLSNILRDLENRNLIRRYEHGSTFDVELEKRVYC